MNVNFLEWDCTVHISHYTNNQRPAIILIDANDMGKTIAIATVNVPEENINNDEVIIKDYAENKGIYDCLQKAGVISPKLRDVRVGRGFDCPLCMLLINE